MFKSNKTILFIMNSAMVFFACKSISFGSELMQKVNQSLTEALAASSFSHDAKARIILAQQQIRPLGLKYDSQLKECFESKESTDTNCAEGNDKGINQFTSMMGSMADAGSMAMSASCSKLADLLKLGQGAMTAFRAQCAVVKSGCMEKCDAAEKTRLEIKKILSKANVDVTRIASLGHNPGEITSSIREEIAQQERAKIVEECSPDDVDEEGEATGCRKRIEKVEKVLTDSNDEKKTSAFLKLTDEMAQAQAELEKGVDTENPTSLKRACQATAQEATSKAGMNIMSLMASMQQNQACAEELQTFNSGIDLTNCALTGTCEPSDPANECKDAKYKDSIYCKTFTRNNTTGNTGGPNGGTGNFADPNFELDTKGGFGDLSMLGGGDGSGEYDPNDPNSPFNKLADGSGSKSPGIPAGGGGGGLSIPGGAYNPRGGGRGPSGGDGVSYGGTPSYAGTGNMGGSGGDRSNADLEKYLPGGEKDPTLKKVGPAGITAPSGLTLFEKITKSYRNNRSTLIPE